MSQIIETGSVIASGGYGKVLKLRNRVIKLIRTVTSCTEAVKEYEKMKRLENALSFALRRPLSVNVRKALVRLHPVKPLEYIDQPLTYEGESFSCGIVSRLIKGVPLERLIHLDKRTYDESVVRQFKSVLVLVDRDMPYSFLSLMDATRPLSHTNPPRYFVLTLEDAKKIYRTTHHFDTPFGFTFQMGVAFAVSVFLTKFSLEDVEFLLGDPTDQRIHIVDLGMSKELPKDIDELIDVLAGFGTPFYTKNVMPNPRDPMWKYFCRGFVSAAIDFGEDRQRINEIIERLEKAL